MSTPDLMAMLNSLLKLIIGPSGKMALLPWVPFPVKLLVYSVFLINWRSWPLMWHWRVMTPVFSVYWGRWRKGRSISSRRQWLDDISCVNSDPMELISVTKCYAGTDSCDYNGHLSNSGYSTAVDTARMQAGMNVFPPIFEDGCWTPLGGTQYYFIREIPMFTEYEIRSTVGGWDAKWMYLVHHFVSYPKKGSKSKAAGVPKAASASAGAPNVSAPPTPDSADKPSKTGSLAQNSGRSEYKAPVTVPAHFVRKPLTEDAVVHCVAVSMICFKIGRITIPPRVAFIASGIGAPEKGRWLRVQELRYWPDQTAKGGVKNRMTDILKGGYKADDRGDDRFWELDEFEGRRKKAVEEIFDGLQESLKGLKEARV